MTKLAVPMMAALGLAVAATCSADVIFKIKATSDLQSKKPTVNTGSLVFDSNRMTTRWDEKDKSRVIFRADKNLMWVVDDEKKSYQQVDKAFIDQMAAQFADAKAEMQARIDKMPPEQRAQAEEMMKQYSGAMAGSATAFKLDYRKTGATKLINGHLCTKYDTYEGKDLISYAWVAPYADLGLVPTDAAVWDKMSDFVSKMATSVAGQEVQKRDYIPMHELGGVPLLTQDVEGGKVVSETSVESVTRAASPAGSYDLPGGYKQEPLPTMEHKKK